MNIRNIDVYEMGYDHVIRFKFNNQWSRSIAIRPNTNAVELGKLMIELGQKIIEDQETVIMRTPNESGN